MEIYLGLGTNLGERKKNIATAVELLEEYFGIGYTRLASLMETEPWGFSSSDRFLNTVVLFDIPVPEGTDIGKYAHELLKACKEIEKQMGRTGVPEFDSEGRRIYHSRIIDIDILLCGDARIENKELTVPHPHMNERDFVMVPLSEIATDKAKAAFPGIFVAAGRI